MYTTLPIVGFGNSAYVRPAIGSGRRVPLNVIKAVSDAFVAHVTDENPKISAVTEGGDWELQERAKGLTKFIEGEFYEDDIYDAGRQVALDGGGIFGAGFFYSYIEGEGKDAKVTTERCYPPEILIDDKQAQYGWKRLPQIGRQRWIDRVELEALYKDDEYKLDRIRAAKQKSDPESGVPGFDSQADQLLVTEMWMKTIGRGKKTMPGRYCRAIVDCTLEDDVWEYSWLPFAVYTKAHAPFGSYGIPIAHELDGTQNEINDLMMRSSKALRLVGAPHVLVERSSKVNFSQWDNEQGSKIEYTGPFKPEVYVPQIVVPPELYAQVERLWARSFDQTGVPQPASEGEAPKNLDSGKAIQADLAVGDRRQQIAKRRYHHMYLELARQRLELAREIVKKHNPNYGAKAMSRRNEMRRILLSEVDLPDERSILKLWETDGLSDDPAARMGQVERMSNAGWISPDTAKRLLVDNIPDLEHESDLENASYNAVESMIAIMLNEGRYKAPIPTLNIGNPPQAPGQAFRQVQLASIKAWSDGRPHDRIQLLLDWLVDAVSVAQGIGGMPAAPQTQAAAPGTPVLAPAAGVTPQMLGGGLPTPPGAPPPMGGPPPGAMPPVAA